ncbi:hypothetical protein FHG87_014335 [Trinorchestia longiramus]|nr:hypothetical protein FHG87_014335 [Trinorchestia longiramus]
MISVFASTPYVLLLPSAAPPAPHFLPAPPAPPAPSAPPAPPGPLAPPAPSALSVLLPSCTSWASFSSAVHPSCCINEGQLLPYRDFQNLVLKHLYKSFSKPSALASDQCWDYNIEHKSALHWNSDLIICSSLKTPEQRNLLSEQFPPTEDLFSGVAAQVMVPNEDVLVGKTCIDTPNSSYRNVSPRTKSEHLGAVVRFALTEHVKETDYVPSSQAREGQPLNGFHPSKNHTLPLSQTPHSHTLPPSQTPHSHTLPLSQTPHSHTLPPSQTPHSHILPPSQTPHSHTLPPSQNPHSHTLPPSQTPHPTETLRLCHEAVVSSCCCIVFCSASQVPHHRLLILYAASSPPPRTLRCLFTASSYSTLPHNFLTTSIN